MFGALPEEFDFPIFLNADHTHSLPKAVEAAKAGFDAIVFDSAARVLLTLHGGSGTDDEDLRKAIAAGINIVHINTELRVAWRRGLEDALVKQPDEVVP
jgi:fructose/tagatose bisphosphate aldolase